MKLKLTLLLIISFFQFSNMNAQSLNWYKWEKRIVLIVTNNENLKIYQDQLDVLTNSKANLKERKVMVCRAMPSQFTFGYGNFTWIHYPTIYDKYHDYKSGGNFEVLLIGLDGEVKLKQTEILGIEELFSIIDTMPMRKAEMERNE
jgi:hypothetical protein